VAAGTRPPFDQGPESESAATRSARRRAARAGAGGPSGDGGAPEARAARRGRERGGRGGGTGARVLAALPAIAFAIFIVVQGGLWWALGIGALAILGLHELYQLTRDVRPVDIAGFVGVLGLLLAALYGDQFHVLLALAASFLLTFLLALVRPWREHVAWAIAVTMLGVLWLGVPFAHAVLLRELPHGEGLVVLTLVGVFVGDTAAYFGGRAWGRRPIAPRISPSKTLEGLISGIVGGGFAFWLFAVSYYDWMKGTDALIIGASVALVAPLGDLFESMIKRDLQAKDTGRFFGAHGGVLDRLDAAIFAIPVAYYVSVAVL
jgi:phosphatidate cytidylyltransferase